MKKFLLVIITVLGLAFSSNVNAQFHNIYNENEKEGLRVFLRQPSAEDGKLNLEQLNLSVSDTLDWKVSEAWVGKMMWILVFEPYEVLDENNHPISFGEKLVAFNFPSMSLAGELDCSYFEALTRIDCYNNSFTDIDVTKNTKLEYLYCQSNQLKHLNVRNNQILRDLRCNENQIPELDITNNLELATLDCGNNQLATLDISKNTKLTDFSCGGNTLTNLNLANLYNLQRLSCGYNLLEKLDLSQNIDLREINCYSNQLTKLDVSKNTKLKWIHCSNNKLTELDVSKNADLSIIECYSNQLNKLDVSTNTKLKILECGYNTGLTKLDVTQNTELEILEFFFAVTTDIDLSKNLKLKTLHARYSHLTNLDLTNNTKLENFTFQSNLLKFSTLTVNNFSKLNLGSQVGQGIIFENKVVAVGDTIDLSAEYMVQEHTTTYKWSQYRDGVSTKNINLASAGNGKFVIGIENIGASLSCYMTNPYYTIEEKGIEWEQVYMTVGKVLPPAVPTLVGNLKLKKSTDQQLYSVSLNESFDVEAVTNYAPADIRMGLFSKTNGEFYTDLTSSRLGNIFSCAIPSNAALPAGAVLAAYIMKDGKEVMIGRPTGSHIIDRLPLSINKTATRSILTDVTTHMQVNTGTKDLHEVDLDQNFQVIAKYQDLSVAVKMGLFETFTGSFVGDITTKSYNDGRFVCSVSSNEFSDGEYILAPYQMVAGKVTLIDRSSDKPYIIDRLPLTVKSDWDWDWDFSMRSAKTETATNAVQITIYPNPVSDMLYINSPETIKSVEVLASGGGVLASGRENSVDVSRLNPGVYMVRIVDESGTVYMQKMMKR